jgi:hypothetical protein
MSRFVFLFAALLFALGCNKGEDTKTETAQTEPPAMEETAPVDTAAAEPDYITVQHILIGFAGSVPGKDITRTREEAESLAAELLVRAQAGEDFDAMVQQYTDDAHPGIYQMANLGVEANIDGGVYPRDQMVPAFGDIGFPLGVGGVGMAAHDVQKSPYGWHIVKRIQ